MTQSKGIPLVKNVHHKLHILFFSGSGVQGLLVQSRRQLDLRRLLCVVYLSNLRKRSLLCLTFLVYGWKQKCFVTVLLGEPGGLCQREKTACPTHHVGVL